MSAIAMIRRKLRGAYLSQAGRVWKSLPASLRLSTAGLVYARQLDRLTRLHADRKQYFATFFLRNRPELELLGRLAKSRPHGSCLRICVLACSKGAEVYSIAWSLRSVRPDLQLIITAVDISQEIVDFASSGIYSFSRSDSLDPSDDSAATPTGSVGWNTSRDQNAWMFERMSQEEIDSAFEVREGTATIRPWLREGISWLCGDAGDPRLREDIGPQDIVVANRFLCHMSPPIAEQCLRTIAHLVAPGGHLFVSGIDLDVRTKVAFDLHWSPVPDLLREIHEGDDSIRRGWPLEYWGLEPFDAARPDCQVRYASAFRIGAAFPETHSENHKEEKGCDSLKQASSVLG
jgi:chemotaxis methyl-accepting protein methylase